MKLKAKIYNVETGKPIVVLNEEDAKELAILVSDRVKISKGGNLMTAIADNTKSFVKEGEIGVFAEVRNALIKSIARNY